MIPGGVIPLLFSAETLPAGAGATGGTITDITDNGVNYRVHTFTSSGSFILNKATTVEYLVVGGGGGASGYLTKPAGGGGGACHTGAPAYRGGEVPGGVGGGGAGGSCTPVSASPGTVNTGGGGGGSPVTPTSGATGGSGIVIIRYKYQ